MTRMPQITALELVQFLKSQGFAVDRQSGSHLTLWNEEKRRAVTVPMHAGCDLGRGLALRILKDAGFSLDDFLRLR
ncbi:MAG TPA: type II toxin-antitoxin system HicA family toxin [Candidatus Hydrogenedentes bacterium]|nr:type II toxin-antitoxin system HicA family toxin [Candidatus Hydrogenedentota bacterium]HQL96062.1 type II toxin-antitoxin system HicA family toxin [Candidatus Hydrogenedentota bacterium]